MIKKEPAQTSFLSNLVDVKDEKGPSSKKIDNLDYLFDESNKTQKQLVVKKENSVKEEPIEKPPHEKRGTQLKK